MHALSSSTSRCVDSCPSRKDALSSVSIYYGLMDFLSSPDACSCVLLIGHVIVYIHYRPLTVAPFCRGYCDLALTNCIRYLMPQLLLSSVSASFRWCILCELLFANRLHEPLMPVHHRAQTHSEGALQMSGPPDNPADVHHVVPSSGGRILPIVLWLLVLVSHCRPSILIHHPRYRLRQCAQ
ncbi:hypothetical protein NEOLEDRAFT_284582 [Neolentinus lepideus HHB14362 ss-1]|uniref:Uncharacterized protein n=1 Tax=Neolentinus lepideus HHB14362 ss-1 TaxID=1314782 RepID=A0A165SZ43_9AGAM|nr:hypothetical protein NEOLEDRAFT_284582 [Neolentinus lepideus HHB14362 ss-1]